MRNILYFGKETIDSIFHQYHSEQYIQNMLTYIQLKTPLRHKDEAKNTFDRQRIRKGNS